MRRAAGAFCVLDVADMGNDDTAGAEIKGVKDLVRCAGWNTNQYREPMGDSRKDASVEVPTIKRRVLGVQTHAINPGAGPRMRSIASACCRQQTSWTSGTLAKLSGRLTAPSSD